MKKLLKISAFALAMSALLFSCADPNNGTKTPETPTVDTVKPTDVKKPEGFTPTEGAKSVTTKADAEKILDKLKYEYYTYREVIFSELMDKMIADENNAEEMKKMNDFKEAIEKAKAEGKDFSDSVTVKTKPADYTFDYGTSSIKLANTTMSVSTKVTEKTSETKMEAQNVFTYNVTDTTKVTREAKPNETLTNYIKSFKASEEDNTTIIETGEKEDITDTSKTNISAMFDDGTYNGIVVINVEINENATNPSTKISYTFYNLKNEVTLETKEVTPPAEQVN